ncbi:MAG: hypothetical protein QM776_00155 [Rhodocyclaceae bacterium]
MALSVFSMLFPLAAHCEQVRFSGQTRADATLIKDALRNVQLITSTRFSCQYIDAVEAQTLPEDYTPPGGPHPEGEARTQYEVWFVTFCDRTEKFLLATWRTFPLQGVTFRVGFPFSGDLEPTTAVYLVPVDNFPFEAANNLANMLSRDLKIKVKATLPMGIADLKELPKNAQLAGEDLIARARDVGQRLPGKAEKFALIALTTRDINDKSQSLRFLFSQNDFSTRTTVISVARMFAPTPQGEGTQAQAGLRLYKMTKRAIGEQYFGLRRSADITDIMYAPIMSLEDIDAMGLNYKEPAR